MKRNEKKDKLTDDLLKLIETMSVNKACASLCLAPSTFRDWIRGDNALSARYGRARSIYCDRLADEIMEISDEEIGLDDRGRVDNGAVQQNRLRVDSRKWLLSKLRPGTYGDRLTIAGDEENPLAITEVKRVIVPKGESKADDDKVSNEGR